MAAQLSKEMKERAQNIPVVILRQHMPDIIARRKGELVRALWLKDPNKLINLATYYTINKERSFYLIKKKKEIKKELDSKKLLRLKGKHENDADNDFIVKCNDVLQDDGRKEVYIKIKVHSKRRKYRGEDPNTLKPMEITLRKGLSVFIVFHEDKNVLECRAKSPYKAEYARMALGKLMFNDVEAFEKIILSPEQHKKLDPNTRFKKAIVTKLRFSGTNEITLKGEDVQNTIGVLKTQHNLDLEKIGDVELIKGELSTMPLKFNYDGKISAKKSVDDPYAHIKGLL